MGKGKHMKFDWVNVSIEFLINIIWGIKYNNFHNRNTGYNTCFFVPQSEQNIFPPIIHASPLNACLHCVHRRQNPW